MKRVEAALKMAEMFAVFPIQPGQKVPLAGSRGFKDASNNPEVIEKWWFDNPALNVGVYPWGGPVKYVVLDIEGESKGNSISGSVKLFTRKTGMPLDLSEQYVVDTPSGGAHVYLKVDSADERVYTSTVNFVKGMDIRAQGGYVLGPGSTVDGVHYKPRSSLLPKPMPAGLGDYLPVKRKKVENNEADESELDLPNNVKRATQFLKDTEPAIEGEGGDSWTFATAAKVRNFGISESLCLSLMNKHFNPRCEPPWDFDDLIIKVENAYEHAQEKQGVDGGDPNLAFGEMIEADAEVPVAAPVKFELYNGTAIKSWPPPSWMIKKTLPEKGLGFIIGPWGSYKTYIAIDLAASIACSQTFASREFKRGGCVLYLAGEGPRGVAQRFEAWFEHMGIAWPEHLYVADRLPSFGDPEQVKAFIAQFKDLNVVAVFVDTISMASLGADENSAKDMGVVLAGMQAMRDGFGAFVMGIHHMGKDQSKGSRGWSGLPAAADVEIQVTADTKKKEAYVLLNKSRDSERWEKKEVFAASRIELDDDSDGDPISNLAFRHNPDAKAPEPASNGAKDEGRWADVKGLMREPVMAGKTLSQAKMIENMRPKWFDHIDTDDEASVARADGATKRWLNRAAKSDEGLVWTVERDEGGDIHWMRPECDVEPEPETDPLDGDDFIDW